MAVLTHYNGLKHKNLYDSLFRLSPCLSLVEISKSGSLEVADGIACKPVESAWLYDRRKWNVK